ncbi:MAG: histidine kinase [Acidobacteriota bacterium]
MARPDDPHRQLEDRPQDGGLAPRRRPMALSTPMLLWTGVACAVVAKTGIYRAVQGVDPQIGRLLVYLVPLWWLWALWTPAVAWLARRFPVDRRRGLYLLSVHVPCAFLLALCHIALDALWMQVAPPVPQLVDLPYAARFRAVATGDDLPLALLTYGAIVAVAHARRWQSKLHTGELRARRLRTRWIQARLAALRLQLHPHFLFNALNGVSTLVVARRRGEALHMLDQLTGFLRSLLEGPVRQRVPLGEELRLARRYLDIERSRFGGRLRVVFDVDDGLRSAPVPALLLQPLIENAIRHGIASLPGGGTVTITARVQDGRLRLAVTDDGVGPPDPQRLGPAGLGVGLENTRDRLRLLYGDAGQVTLHERPGGGTRVLVELPLSFPPTLTPGAPEPLPDVAPHGSRSASPGRRSASLWIGLGWAVPGVLLVALGSAATAGGVGEAAPLAPLLGLPLWWFWWLATPIVLSWARRFPVDRRRTAAAHLPLALSLSVAHMAAVAAVFRWLGPQAVAGTQLPLLLAGPWFDISLFSYLVILCGHRAATSQRGVEHQRARWAELEGRLAQADDDRLRLRLRPKALLERLASLRSLVAQGRHADAEEAIQDLAANLRIALDPAPTATPTPNLR